MEQQMPSGKIGIAEILANSNGVPKEFVIGRLYHTSWAKNRSYVWKLVAMEPEKDIAHLRTPKTYRALKTQLSSLRDVNKTIISNAK